jgi:cytochrome b subunit of formate dehydrogenase
MDENSFVKNGKIQMYTKNEVAGHWVIFILMFLVIITTLPLFRDVLFHVLAIYGGIWIPTPDSFMFLHRAFAGILIVVSLIYFFLVTSSDKINILMKRPFKDFKAYGHSVFYFFFMAKRERHGGTGMYRGSQRMVFMALVYAIGLLGISGVFMLAFPENEAIMSIMGLTHNLMTGLGVLVIMYHVGINIRRHDSTGLNCYFFTGYLPLSYIKKHHKVWFRDISAHEKKLEEAKTKIKRRTIDDPVVGAVKRFVEMESGRVSQDQAEDLARRFKKDMSKEDLDYLVEVSKTLD